MSLLRPRFAPRLAPACLLALLLLLPGAGAAAQAPDDLPPELARRLAQLDPDDVPACAAAAAACVRAERIDLAMKLCRHVLRRDPGHEDAYALISGLAAGRPIPAESEPRTKARTALPESFVARESEHFVLFSDADPAWSRTQLWRLERTHDRFIAFARAAGLRPLPLRHRIVAIAFANLEDYLAFARANDGSTGAGVAGYYNAVHDHLVYFHVESDRNVARAREDLERLAGQADAMRRDARRARSRGQGGDARALRRRAGAVDDRLAEESARLDAFARARSSAVTLHEAIHALAFGTEVQSRFVMQPLWLTEGLATAFESDEPGGDFGPDRDFALRRDVFEALADAGRLLPLADLIALDHGAIAGRMDLAEVLYAQSCAFVSWLCVHRRGGLAEFLAEINAAAGKPFGAAEQRAAFERAFGPIDRIEEQWRRYEGVG